MNHILLIAGLVLPLVHSKTSGELCRGTGGRAPDGNWYCAEVRAITYRNISQIGVYNRTTFVDPSSGICGHETVSYQATGDMTPLFGEVSMHLRGPMNVSQLAVYQLPADMHTLRKRKTVPFYDRRRALRLRDADALAHGPVSPSSLIVGDRTAIPKTSCGPHTVTATVTVRDCDPPHSTSTVSAGQDTPSVSSSISCIQNGRKVPPGNSSLAPHYACTHTTSLNALDQPKTHADLNADRPHATKQGVSRRAASDWSRVGYYTSTAPAQATGLSFLANLGDPRRSGTFDYAFGNSLSYVSSNGGQVTDESTPFEGILSTSEREIAVFSDKSCDQDCPYWRPDATSHFGWSGASKAFFIEFQMDHYQNIGTDQGLISDAPAWWFLNAAIPRVLQYGNDRNNIPCSCWSTGCGEFDAFEILGNGEERAKSTLHRQGNLEGGDSNYFKRPVGRKLKFAVVWSYPNITAFVLDDDFDFGETLSNDEIQRLVSYNPDSWTHSLFAIGD